MRIVSFVLGVLSLTAPVVARAEEAPRLVDPRETHFGPTVQLTFGGENAEAYWSPDGRELVLQSTRPPYGCDQILRIPATGAGEATLVSSGKGRTTCSYFTYPDGERIVFATTEKGGDACPPPPDRSLGYVWALYPEFDIVSVTPDGKEPRWLTDTPGYDAEATACPVNGTLVFTSVRDGDIELYTMKPDGSDVKRITNTPGYDGGAFFSNDCKQLVWRASRPQGADLDEYRRLLAQNLVRPSKLEIWVANADGSEARQITDLGAASFAPSFFPSGKRILFSTNFGDPRGREFDIYAVDTDGTDLERITFSADFDGFPLFSPDGKRLVFASNRNNGKPGDTNVFVTEWQGGETPNPANLVPRAADRYLAEVAWLADDARSGRGLGTPGLDAARDWLAERFRELGLEPAGEDGFFDRFEAAVAIESGPATRLVIDGTPVAAEAFVPAGFSGSARAAGEVVPVGFGIVMAEKGLDDYAGLDVTGKVVAVRRFAPDSITEPDDQRRASDLRQKAFMAREKGAVGMIVVDRPAEGVEEAPLPGLHLEGIGDSGIPVVIAKGAAAAALFDGGAHRVEIAVELHRKMAAAANVVARLPAGAAQKLAGPIVVGAHYDHLGHGGAGSLAPDSQDIHNGADDNASGTAALLEVARHLLPKRAELARDVVFIAFSGEESGLLGSTAFTRQPTGGVKIDGDGEVFAMVNMDMVGKLRGQKLSILGADSAAEWRAIVEPLCSAAKLDCHLGGDGFGPSDQTPFYAAGIPVLHAFTGTHFDYHKPSDDTAGINATGGVAVAGLVAAVTTELAGRASALTYQSVPSPAPRGDLRSYGASLGTVPDYAGTPDGRPGLLLAGVRPGSAAEKAGIQRGDILVHLAGREVRDIYDLMFVLQRSKPGETVKAVVEREGRRVEFQVTFEASRGRGR
ncbi:MAG: M20/M25/M40 family metallo-hydrolase [Thermoanaerobaculia bacterium]|nr:M20/M25/M40 family metallo-hydrolase [Thermoanaerobaculia bacterium]